MSTKSRLVDVLVAGAGPVGLITAYQLARFGGVSVAIIEKHAKSIQDDYGRAITLYPRSSEMLDQLELADELAQQCFACRDTVSYDSAGNEVHNRGWSFMEAMKEDTYWGFALVLRQKYQEDIFREALKRYGIHVEAPAELTAVRIDDSIPLGGHRITATVNASQQPLELQCRYLIGCDGGRSSVRRMLKIPFNGATTEDRWVRIDGLVKTNMPKPRTYCSIESPTHGNVLWAALDRGATRIGYAFTADRAEAYEVFDEAAAVKEAIAAVKPFILDFERVDWWTIYSVGQRIAASFFVQNCVFLAGDACHTHSSGAAQGMNTGLHDAINLGWKLSLVLRGLACPGILQTYEAERLPNVERLIKYDKDISRLMTNRLPEGWNGDPNVDKHEILAKIMAEAGTFSSGLGIFYDVQEDNPLNVAGSLHPAHDLDAVGPGKRTPDVTLLKPGTFEPTRLLSITRNWSCFHVLVFAGQAYDAEGVFARTAKASCVLHRLHTAGCIKFRTVLAKTAASAWELLHHDPLGRVYFDTANGAAHRRYAIDESEGAVVVVRPDGWIGTMSLLSASAVIELEQYFGRIFEPQITSKDRDMELEPHL